MGCRGKRGIGAFKLLKRDTVNSLSTSMLYRKCLIRQNGCSISGRIAVTGARAYAHVPERIRAGLADALKLVGWWLA